MDAYRAGEVAALEVLTSLGRDAAHPALAYAEELGDPELIEHARRLVAVPPAIETNLYELREAAVDAILNRGRSAPLIEAAEGLTAQASFGLFDPSLAKAALVRGGRPRKEIEQERAGTIAVFGLSVPGKVTVHIEADKPPAGVPTTRRRLKVGSGVVVVGAPEASDGPRLGSVRLPPERTGLDDFLEARRVTVLRLSPGIYAVEACHQGADTLRVYVSPDPAPKEPLPFEKDPSLAVVPLAAE